VRVRRPRLGCLFGLVFLLAVLAVVALGFLAGPLAGVQTDATSAREELTLAADAVQDGKPRAAQRHVDEARYYVDRADDAAFGLSGDVWQWVPVAGGAVRDMRHLVAALDETTSVAEIAVDVYPRVTDPQRINELMRSNRVDVAGIAEILADVEQAYPHLTRARDELAEVEGDAPIVGSRISAARDAAQARIDPLADAADRIQPLAEGLPTLLGADGRVRYLVGFMNPSEQRYSGGAVLTSTSLTARDGRLTFGEVDDQGQLRAEHPDTFGSTWPAVKGNPFHGRGMVRLPKATIHPDWTVSGEELLRAYRAKGLGRYDAVIVVDPVALARLLKVSGPFDVPGLGRVDHANLVRLLVGSYDQFNEQSERKALNEAVFTVFRERFFAADDLAGKVEALGDAAAGRHLAVYSAEEELQDMFDRMGVSGRLSSTEQDYLGVFSRNLTASKADYWQARTVHTRVGLTDDGDARVRMQVDVANTAPPYQQQPFQARPEDPGRGYWTKILVSMLMVVLPDGAEAGQVTLDGDEPEGEFPAGRRPAAPAEGRLEDGRQFIEIPMRVEREETSRVRLRYTKPGAAEVDGDTMTYRLDYDPQGMVKPQALDLRVRFPEGWYAEELPPGWQQTSQGARFSSPAQSPGEQWEIVLLQE
jgi:hypothetical protein